MKKVSVYKYYSFGFNYYLSLRDSENRTNSSYFEWLEKYRDEIFDLDMHVTKSAMNLKDFDELFSELENLAKDENTKDEKIAKSLHSKINKCLNEIDHVLDAEINLKHAYELEEKRTSNEILLGNVDKLLPKSYFGLLSSIAQFDLNESGYCLAFNRFTASAFHSLRAMEEILKMYYEKVLSITASDKDTWGTYSTALKTAVTKKTLVPPPDEELISNIDSLRKFYRNKTQHPQLIYSSDEAQDLLAYCTKTISQIIKDLRKRKLI